ncbi:MAG: XRE family transcriptional regulator [Hymenobacter sp.]|nr:MAG: XRE family transcriptional regulator [Hymenobacter sp.]
MSKSVLLLFAAIGAGTLAAQAQIGTQPDWTQEIAIIKAQPLVVLLNEEDPKELRKLADKPAELAQYKTYVAQYNAQLQQLARELWQFSPAVTFQSEADYQELRKANELTQSDVAARAGVSRSTAVLIS